MGIFSIAPNHLGKGKRMPLSQLLPCMNAGSGVSGCRPENRDLKVVATLERTQYKEALPPRTLNIASPPFLDMYKLSLDRKEGS